MDTSKRYLKDNWQLPLTQDNDVDCGELQTPILNIDNNDLHLNITGNEFIQMLSAIHQGAEVLYPERLHYLTDKFLSALLCPPELEPEQGDCLAYPNYAPFISYLPISPFNNPNEVPDGYIVPPFHVFQNGEGDSFGYQDGDIQVPFDAITADPFDLFTGTVPQIQIRVVGSGQIEIDLLSFVLGGIAIISVNNPPDFFDILNGVFGSGETLIDLELDASSFPPETDIVSAQEVNIDAGVGVESIVYITFFPVIDDALIPVRFGGGLRANGIQLCGFEQSGVIMGITDVRIQDGKLQAFENGMWTDKGNVLEDCSDVEPCLISSPTITNIQAQITSNDSDIANLQNADMSLQNQITSNDNDITALQTADTNLQSQINANIIAIGDINNDIDAINTINNSQQTQINSNTVSIADLISVTNNHETRITALENSSGSGGGSFDTITIETERYVDSNTLLSNASTMSIDIPQGYKAIVLRGEIVSQQVVSADALDMFANSDMVSSNYQFYFPPNGAQNYGRIARVPQASANTAGIRGRFEIYMDYPHLLAPTLARCKFWFSNGLSTASGEINTYVWYYEQAVSLESVTFQLEGQQMLAGTNVKVYVLESTEVCIPSSGWSATFDFSEDDYSDLWSFAGYVYHNGYWTNDVGGQAAATVQFNVGNAVSYDSVEITYRIAYSAGKDPYIYFGKQGVQGETDFAPTLDADTVKIFGATELPSGTHSVIVAWDNTDGSPYQDVAQLKKLVLRGSGTPPSELVPYLD